MEQYFPLTTLSVLSAETIYDILSVYFPIITLHLGKCCMRNILESIIRKLTISSEPLKAYKRASYKTRIVPFFADFFSYYHK